MRFTVPAVRQVHETPSRCEVALGGVRVGVVPRSELLPLMVRSSHLLNIKLTPRFQLVQTFRVRYPRSGFLLGDLDVRRIRWSARRT